MGWKKTLTGWYKLDTNGCVSESLKTRGVGGVVRNEEGTLVNGFTIRAGFGLGVEMETWC